jgi:hypothetical protein
VVKAAFSSGWPWGVLAALVVGGVAGCLGPAPEPPSADASVDTHAHETGVNDDAAVDDATLDGGSSSSDSPGDDGSDAELTCVEGGSCTPSECMLGATICSDSGASCSFVENRTNGTGCDGGIDGGAVCSGGACVACALGEDCTEAGSCQQMNIVCSTGSPVCTAAGNVTDGKPCGTNLFCNMGKCATCMSGASCPPMGKPCDVGTVSCSAGQLLCNDTHAAAANGTSCGANMVCSGGACVQCIAGATCPLANPCHTGRTSCSTGTSLCQDMGAGQDGVACTGTSLCNKTYTCKSGTCTGTNPVTCTASDSCHAAGTCDPTTGQCSTPLASAGSGFAECGGVCVNVTTDAKNCGACGHSCLYGTCATTCQPWLVYKPSGGAAGIACDGTNLVWMDTASLEVLQVPAGGGSTSPIQLATVGSGNTFQFIRMADGIVAFTTKDSSSLIDLWTASESTSVTVQLSPLASFGTSGDPNVERGLGINATGGTAYLEYFDDFTGQGNVEACSLALNNGTCSAIAPSTGGVFPDDLGVGSANLFLTENGNSLVESYALGSTSSANEATGQNGPYLITTDSSFVYWANKPTAGTSFSVNRGPQAAPNPASPQIVLSSTPGTLNAIASDGKYVYLGGSFSSVELGYVAVAGGALQTLHPGSGQASSVAAVGGAVYYIDSTDNAIHGIAAPP